MINSARVIIFLLLAALLPLTAESSEYMLFSPRPLEGELLIPERGKGVLVRRITIKAGDTLSQISRDFSGRGSYFPQILLFNDIRNPDLIRAGRDLFVPVSKQNVPAKTQAPEKQVSPPAKKHSLPRQKAVKATAAKASIPAEQNQRQSAGKTVPQKPLPTEQLGPRGEQDSFSMAMSAYRKEEYKKSLSLFSRFLELYPSSSLAPDAALYKAESLLKLADY